MNGDIVMDGMAMFPAFKKLSLVLASVAQLVGVSSHNLKVVGSIPSQNTVLGCEFDP